jgi:hypothetical protein
MYGLSKWLTCRIWPLVGGIILDWVGVDVVAPICTTTILVGSLVAASGVQIGNWRVLAGGYLYYAKRKMPAQYRVSTGRERSHAGGARKLLSLESLWLLPWCFWMLPATQLLQSGAAGGFSVARADIIRM